MIAVSPKQLQSRMGARDILAAVLDGNHSQNELCEFLAALKNIPLNAEWVLGFRDAIMARAKTFDFDVPVIDICGTGGDGKNTFNISTLAALTLAAAGHAVAKHGNSAASSASGSSDILRALEISLPADAAAARGQLDACGITFLHAPHFHPALAAIGAARKQVNFPTVFNILGPLCHPAAPAYRILGVASREVYDIYRAAALHACPGAGRGGGNYAIIHDEAGYDKMSLTAPARICVNGEEQILTPEDFDLAPLAPEELKLSNDMTENKNTFLAIARGVSHHKSTAVAANAAVAMHLAEPSHSIAQHFQTAREILQSGRVQTIIEKLRGQR